MNVGELLVQLRINMDEFRRGMSEAQTRLSRVQQDAEKGLGPAMEKIGSALKIVGVAASTGFGALVTSGVMANSSMEQYRNTLNTVMQDSKKAGETLDWVKQYAAKTPFEIPELVESTVKLQGMGLEAQKFIPVAADMAAVFKSSGKSVGDAAEAINDAMMGEFERLKEFGIKLQATDFSAGGKYAGKTYAEAIDEEVKNHHYTGAADALGATFAGRLSTLKDTIGQSIQAITAPIFEKLAVSMGNVLDKINEITNNGSLQAWTNQATQVMSQLWDITVKVGGVLVDVGKGIAEHWGLIGPILAGVLAGFLAYETVTGVIKAVAAAHAALNLVMAANPIALVVLAIAGLVAAGVALYQNWDVLKAKTLAAWSEMKQTVISCAEGMAGGIATLFDTFGLDALAASANGAQIQLRSMLSMEQEMNHRRGIAALFSDVTVEAPKADEAIDTTAGKIVSLGKSAKDAAKEAADAIQQATDSMVKDVDRYVSVSTAKFDLARTQMGDDSTELTLSVNTESDVPEYLVEYQRETRKLEIDLQELKQQLVDNAAKINVLAAAYEQAKATLGEYDDVTRDYQSQLELAIIQQDKLSASIVNNSHAQEAAAIRLAQAQLEAAQKGYDGIVSAAKDAETKKEETFKETYDAAKEKYEGIVNAARNAYEETVNAAAAARDEEILIYQDQLDEIDEAESARSRQQSRQDILDKIKNATTAKDKTQAQIDLAEWDRQESVRIQKESIKEQMEAAKDKYTKVEKQALQQRDTVIAAADAELAAEKNRYDVGLAEAKEHYRDAKVAADAYYSSLGLAIDTVTGKLEKMKTAAQGAAGAASGVSSGTNTGTGSNSNSNSNSSNQEDIGKTLVRTISSANYINKNGTTYMQLSNFPADAQSYKNANTPVIYEDGYPYYGIASLYRSAGYEVDWDGSNVKIYKYAKGTKEHSGGLAILGDGEGVHKKELYRTPDGKLGMSADHPELIDLPKGSEVYSGDETYDLLKNKSYADGTVKVTSDSPYWRKLMENNTQSYAAKKEIKYDFVYKNTDFKEWNKGRSNSMGWADQWLETTEGQAWGNQISYGVSMKNNPDIIVNYNGLGDILSLEVPSSYVGQTSAGTTTETTSGTPVTSTTTDAELPINSSGVLIGDINSNLSSSQAAFNQTAAITESALGAKEAGFNSNTTDLAKEQFSLEKMTKIDLPKAQNVVATLRTAYADAAATYGANSQYAKGFADQLAVAENNLTAVSNKIAVQTGKVADLTTQTSGYTKAVKDNNTALTDAQGKLATATTAYNTAKSTVASLTTQLEAANTAHQKFADARVTGTAAYEESQYQTSLQTDQYDLQIALEEKNKTTGYKSRIRKLEKQKEALAAEANIASLQFDTTVGAQQHLVDQARSGPTNEMSAAAITAGYISTGVNVAQLTSALETANTALSTAQANMEGLQAVTEALTSLDGVLSKTYASATEKDAAVTASRTAITTAWAAMPTLTTASVSYTPSVTYAAEGGIATKPTLGIWGKAGAEALIPLTKLPAIIVEALSKLPPMRMPALPQVSLAGVGQMGNQAQNVNMSFTFSGPMSIRDATDIKTLSREIYNLAETSWRTKGLR